MDPFLELVKNYFSEEDKQQSRVGEVKIKIHLLFDLIRNYFTNWYYIKTATRTIQMLLC